MSNEVPLKALLKYHFSCVPKGRSDVKTSVYRNYFQN